MLAQSEEPPAAPAAAALQAVATPQRQPESSADAASPSATAIPATVSSPVAPSHIFGVEDVRFLEDGDGDNDVEIPETLPDETLGKDVTPESSPAPSSGRDVRENPAHKTPAAVECLNGSVAFQSVNSVYGPADIPPAEPFDPDELLEDWGEIPDITDALAPSLVRLPFLLLLSAPAARESFRNVLMVPRKSARRFGTIGVLAGPNGKPWKISSSDAGMIQLPDYNCSPKRSICKIFPGR